LTSRRQIPFDFAHRPSFRGEDFLVAAPNAEAVGWLERWPDWPSTALVLYGPAGCGKSHLARLFVERSGGVMADGKALAHRIEGAPVVIDDAEPALAGHEEALFHLYNRLKEQGGHLLLTARRPPAQWGIALPDLRSRILSSVAVGVGLPDDALMAQLLVKLFADRQLRVDADVIPYMVSRMERSFDAARRLVAALDRAGLAEGRAVTIPLAREVLAAEDGRA
jgi:DnaA regulatory inactivator Hda